MSDEVRPMFRYSSLITHHSSLITLLLFATPAAAQDDRPSHVPVPRAADADPTRLFQDRIQHSKSRADLDSLLRQVGPAGAFRNPEQLRQLLENNPALRDMARKMADDLASDDPATRERLRGLINSVLQSNPDLARRYGLTPQMVERQLRNAAPGRAGGDATPPPAPPPRTLTHRPSHPPPDRPAPLRPA